MQWDIKPLGESAMLRNPKREQKEIEQEVREEYQLMRLKEKEESS